MRKIILASMLVLLMVFSVVSYSFQSIDVEEQENDILDDGVEESAAGGRQSVTHAEWTMDTLMFSAADCNFSGVSDAHPPATGANDGVSHYHVVGCGSGTMNSPPGGDSVFWSAPGSPPDDLDVGLKNWYQTDFEMDQGGNMYVVGTYSGERMVLPGENGADIILNNSGGAYQCSHFDANSGGVDKSQWTCSPDVFVAKMDPNGIWQWAERVDHMGQDSAVKLAVTPSGDVYVGGYTGCDHFGASMPLTAYDGVARFGSHSLRVCEHDTGVNAEGPGYYGQDWQGYVAKMNTNGVWQWVKAIENWDNEASAVWDVAVDPREPDEVYFIGEIGPCDPYLVQMHSNWSVYTNCPPEQNSVIGKISQVGAPGQAGSVIIDWINYEGIDVTFSEIEAKNAAIFVTGGEHQYAGSSYQHSFGTTSSVQNGDVFITKLDDGGAYEWTRSCQNGGILEMAASSNNIAMEVVPGTQCGQLNNVYHGFQIVTLDSGGNWLWSTGDTFDSSSANLPMTLQWAAYDSWYNTGSNDATGVLEFDSNGDVVSVRSFGKMMKIGGSTILPSYHRVDDAYQATNVGPNGGWVDAEYVGFDTHFSRFDMASGGMMWSYVEDLPTPCVINCVGQPEYFGYPDGYDLGNTQSVWDVEVDGVWDIRISGAVGGHDVQLHDGLPDTDIPYTGPPNHHTRNYYDGGVYFADFDGCVPAPPSPVLVDGSVASSAARWIGGDVHTWDNYSLLVDPVRYECANETVTTPVTFGCTDPVATNYDPAATVDDGTCVYPPPPLDDCCAHYGSIVNLTGVEKLHVMEITAPSSAGSPQGASAGFYDISYDIAQETMPGGVLVTDFSDSQQMAYSGLMGVGTANNCDLLTGARECYDFYLSDSQGNLDPYGGHLAIRLYASSMAAGNIDGVWLEFTNGNIANAAVVTHYDPGAFQTYGGGHSLEALGPVSNDPTVTPISNPTGYTQMGGGPGGDFTTLVVCFDVLVNPEYRSDNFNEDSGADAKGDLDITGSGDTADAVVIGGAGLLAGIGVSSILGRVGRGSTPRKGFLRDGSMTEDRRESVDSTEDCPVLTEYDPDRVRGEPLVVDGEKIKEKPTFEE